MPVKRPQQDGHPLVFKMILIGDSSVGKTSIMERIISNNFSSNNQPTLGA